jgi:hypothetical protein
MNDEQIFFTTSDGVEYVMEHYQSCCESVYIESIVGDLQDLVGNPILLAEEATNEDNPMYEHDEAFQWTFYKFATIKGYVDIRWYGSSNGYYSVGVDFDEVRKTYY